MNWIVKLFKGKKDNLVISVDRDSSMSNDGMDSQPEIVKAVQDPYKIVMNDSSNRLSDLKIYVNFFRNNTLNSIYNQTELVHDVFKTNADLKYRKLDQYHYTYTDHLIELLKKTKKAADDNYLIADSQVNSQKKNIANLRESIASFEKKDYLNKQMQYARYVTLQLSTIYNCLVDGFNDFRFISVRNFVSYSKTISDLDFFLLPDNIYNELIEYDIEKNYTYENFFIDRLLMGKLQKSLFSIEFCEVFYNGNSKIELFKISDSNTHFIYIVDLNIFKIVDYTKIAQYVVQTNTKIGKIQTEIQVLTNKLHTLNQTLENTKSFDNKTLDILDKYLLKIEDINLIDHIAEVDLERRNLDSMLDLTLLDI